MIINPIIPIWIMLLFLPFFWICRSLDKKKFIRQIVIVILIFLINLRPMFKIGTSEIMTNELDVLFVIDTTISMVAEDYNGSDTRLSAVKKDCRYIMEKLNGSKFSIVTFDDTSKIMVPFTMDANLIGETIDILNVSNYVYAKGTSLNKPITNMESVFMASEKNSSRARIVFFISDGEITNDVKVDEDGYSDLKQYISDGAVLGYGTEQGGYMYVNDLYEDSYTYVEDRTSYPYKKAVSRIDEDNLEIIADSLGVDYIHMDNQSNIDAKLEEITSGVEYKTSKVDLSSYEDIYYIFVIPLVGLLGYEFVMFRRVS